MGFFLLGVASFAIAGAAVGELTASQVYQSASRSVVTIVTLGPGGDAVATGSGVHLGGGAIVTNCHVLEGGSMALVTHEEQLVRATHLLGRDETWDICILETTISLASAQTGSSSAMAVGDRVYALGAPRGLSLSLSDGLVSRAVPLGVGSGLQVTAPISPGSSGGGLFNTRGELVGITTLYLEDSQQLNFAVPVEAASILLGHRQARTPIDELAPSPPITPAPSGDVAPDPADRVAEIAMGPQVDSLNNVTLPSEIFEAHDQIYLTLSSTSREPVGVDVVWTYGRDKQFVAHEHQRVPPGHRAAFHITKPDGWPIGTYDAEIKVDGQTIETMRFCVQNRTVRCSKSVTRVYSYDKAGRRHYSSTPPPPDATGVRIIAVPYWSIDPR